MGASIVTRGLVDAVRVAPEDPKNRTLQVLLSVVWLSRVTAGLPVAIFPVMFTFYIFALTLTLAALLVVYGAISSDFLGSRYRPSCNAY